MFSEASATGYCYPMILVCYCSKTLKCVTGVHKAEKHYSVENSKALLLAVPS